MNINKLRNNILNAAISVLGKAKARPNPAKEALKALLDDPNLSDVEKLRAITFLHNEINKIKENRDA